MRFFLQTSDADREPLVQMFHSIHINTCRRPEKPLDFCEGEGARQLCASAPLTSTTSMTLLRITIFKREPSFPSSDKPIIILHLHDKEVCLCTRLCMDVCVSA